MATARPGFVGRDNDNKRIRVPSKRLTEVFSDRPCSQEKRHDIVSEEMPDSLSYRARRKACSAPAEHSALGRSVDKGSEEQQHDESDGESSEGNSDAENILPESILMPTKRRKRIKMTPEETAVAVQSLVGHSVRDGSDQFSLRALINAARALDVSTASNEKSSIKARKLKIISHIRDPKAAPKPKRSSKSKGTRQKGRFPKGAASSASDENVNRAEWTFADLKAEVKRQGYVLPPKAKSQALIDIIEGRIEGQKKKSTADVAGGQQTGSVISLVCPWEISLSRLHPQQLHVRSPGGDHQSPQFLKAQGKKHHRNFS
jgi:hypothetical protein